MSLWTERRNGAVATLSYANPPRNFLTFAALAELETRLVDIAQDDTVHVVVLRSDVDGYFVAHADLDELSRLASGPVPEAAAWYTAMRQIERMPQPVVAAIDGQAWGGGVELALACTMRWASRRSDLALIETSLGIIPGAGGTQRLIRLVGRGVATDLVLSGAALRADAVQAIGLVSRVFDTDDFDDRVHAAAIALATKPREALVAAKRVMREGSTLDTSSAMRLEGHEFARLLATPESLRLQADARRRYAETPASERVWFERTSW
ncbi:enoyl-CoA hydratase/isomerase family protein [Dactylosporangium sp. CA-233914]|uniref:enoyl-CoA hydratase/isomerase family protein n=1 Tax=Dactylosporangium sp. CA-233914 TaxID=3239934 RepID=UPI003D8D3674